MSIARKRILIVEDDLTLSDVLANKLKLEGFDVSTAPDGQVAMDLLNVELYNLILLDLMMPWFDGFHVLTELQKKDTKPPVIVLSSLASKDDINKAKAMGAMDYLVKTSVTPELIVKEIKKYV